MDSKKGLLVSAVAIVALIVVAALGYNVLKDSQNAGIPGIDLSSSASSAAQTNATNSAAEPQTSSGEAANAQSDNAQAGDDYITFEDFTIKTLDGQDVQLSSFYGKPTLLGFWATWCPPCNAEAPEIQKLYERYGDQVNFVMVDSGGDGRDTAEIAQEWLDEKGLNYPVYIDETGEAAFETDLYYLPTMYVLDKEGRVLTAFSGALDVQSGTKLIEQLLAL